MAKAFHVHAGIARLVTIGASALVLTTPASAYRNSWDPTPLEIAQLPPYCQGTFRQDLAKADPNYRMPDCGQFFNHFCPGMVAMNRASDITMPVKDRLVMRNEFRGHLTYTVTHMPATCPLAPVVEVMKTRLKYLDMTLK